MWPIILRASNDDASNTFESSTSLFSASFFLKPVLHARLEHLVNLLSRYYDQSSQERCQLFPDHLNYH